MSRIFFATTFLFPFYVFSSVIEHLEEAPMEWLVAQTVLVYKSEEPGTSKYKKGNELVNKIFSKIGYDQINDGLIIKPSQRKGSLRDALIKYLKKSINDPGGKLIQKRHAPRPRPREDIIFERVQETPAGVYYFNHIHTEFSQDNEDVDFLKLSPQRTFKTVQEFLEKRNTKGVLSVTDHNNDKAFSSLKKLQNQVLQTIRSVEWGGKTHIGLIGVDPKWPLLPHGREFSGEESVIKSRSSRAVRVINHPNRDKVFHYKFWLDADAVEVWNTILDNNPYAKLGLDSSNNPKAMEQWVESLKAGKSYSAVAGTDFHFTIPCLRDRTLHYPANFIPTTNLSSATELFSRGQVSFLTGPEVPKLTLQAKFQSGGQWANMGGHLNGQGKVYVRLFADFKDKNVRLNSLCYNVIKEFWDAISFWQKERWELRFYGLSGELLASRRLRPKRYGEDNSLKAKFDFSVEKKAIIRAELWKLDNSKEGVELLAATNPVYFNFD